jgi:hypothetical protein
VATARRHTERVLLVGLLPCDEARMQPPPWSEDGGEPTASASGSGPGCDDRPVVGPAPAADHLVPVGLDLRQPDGRLRDPLAGPEPHRQRPERRRGRLRHTGIASVFGTLFGGVIVDRG